MDEGSPATKKHKSEGGYTYVKKHKVLYKWNLINMTVRMMRTNFECLVMNSSEFTTGSKLNDRWRVKFYFNNGYSPTYSVDNLSVYLRNLNSFDVTAEFSFFILNKSNEKIGYRNYTRTFTNGQKNWGIPDFVSKKMLLANKFELLPNDILTVCIEVTITNNDIVISPTISFDPSKEHLIQDLKKLYDSRQNSDVTVIIKDKKFQAHKTILMARSSVLAAMFTHDMAEKKSNELTIIDITPETFEKILQYIYTGEVSDLDADAANLLEAADKYQLHTLKKLCEKSLCQTLNPDNAIQTMTIADRHKAVDLLKYASRCIVVDAENISESDSFKEMEKSPMGLGFQLFRTLIDFNSTKSGVEIIYSS